MKNLLNIKEFEVNGMTYEFRLSYKAKVEIERITRKNISSITEDGVLEAITCFSKFDDENITMEEKAELLPKIKPLLENDRINLTGDIEPIELGYILLHNTKGFMQVTKEEYFDEIIPSIEEAIGFVKMYEEFKEMHEKVFTVMEEINKPKQVPIPPKELLS